MSETEKREKTHRESFAEQIKIAQAPFVRGLSRTKWAAEQLRLQNEQVPAAIAAERQFVEVVRQVPKMREEILRGLLESIESEGRGRAVAARAFFRERNVVYNREVIPAITAGNWQALDSFAVNWSYLAWAWRYVQLDQRERLAKALGGSMLPTIAKPFVEGKKRRGVSAAIVEIMLQLTELVSGIRRDLVVTNLQLIADRARAFNAVTPATNQAEIMDHISVAAEGTMAGIDKVMLEARPMPHWPKSWHPVEGFVYWRGESASASGELVLPEFVQSGHRADGHHTADKHRPKVQRPECPASVFRTTAIGRMGGRLIQTYSQTHMHLGPGDKRLLYQANKVAAEFSESGTPNYEGMAERIVLDRVLWNFAKKAKVEVREIASPIAHKAKEAGIEAAVGVLAESSAPSPPRTEMDTDESWAAKVAEREKAWPAAVAAIPQILAAAKRNAPTADQVSSIMLWNSTVPVVNDEGSDKLVEGSAYAAPRSSEPDVALEANEEKVEVVRGLAQLTLLQRKLLVLLDLAPLECVLPEANASA